MSIESLKQQARRHEQNEEWQKALDQYNKALAELAREEQVDIGLYNRVGDLYVRTGDTAKAVEHYEKAIDLYREAYLPNNAIAVCKKIIRSVPDRHTPYLRMGQIRAEQGFLPDARTNFLTYAERMQQSGDLDESFRALIEFCDLAPDDVGVRVTVAEQMAANGRSDEAVEQLLLVRQHFAETGDPAQAEEIENKILALDPEADLSAVPSMGGAFAGTAAGDEIVADFGDISLGGVAEEEVAVAADEGTIGVGDFDLSSDSSDAEIEMPSTDFGLEEEAEEAVELPTMDFEGDEEGEAVELPMMSFGDEDDAEGAVDLPTMEFEETASHDEVVAEVQIADFEADTADEEVAVELPTMDFEVEPDETEAAAELPTMDFEVAAEEAVGEEAAGLEEVSTADFAQEEPEPVGVAEDIGFDAPVAEDLSSGLDLVAEGVESDAAQAMEEAAEEAAADVREEPPVEVVEPPAEVASEPEPAPAADAGGDSGDSFVDLGAMILGGEEEKSTRFTVAYEEPTGDEEADFAKMLSQFKEKVSENLDSSDVRAHYDLGTAYKEMGLLDEAITSFQAALRASADHLPTYELMGQTFIEMGQPEAAVNSLQRALQVGAAVEDDLVGIYYYLARAYEALQQRDSAVEYYDRVFALDINFADVTERLRELR